MSIPVHPSYAESDVLIRRLELGQLGLADVMQPVLPAASISFSVMGFSASSALLLWGDAGLSWLGQSESDRFFNEFPMFLRVFGGKVLERIIGKSAPSERLPVEMPNLYC